MHRKEDSTITQINRFKATCSKYSQKDNYENKKGNVSLEGESLEERKKNPERMKKEVYRRWILKKG